MGYTKEQDDLEQSKKELAALREQTVRVQAEASAEHVLYQLRKAQAQEPQRKQQLEEQERKNRAIFPEICKTLGLSNIEANFRVLVDLTEELSLWAAQQVMQSNAASLVQATEKEIAAWELEEKQNLARFISEARSPLLTPTQKKQISAREAEERDNAARERQQVEYGKIIDQDICWLRDGVAEIQQRQQLSRLSTTELREISTGRQTTPQPQLPPEITYEKIKRMPSEELRALIIRFGREAVDERCGVQKSRPDGRLVRNINQDAFIGLRR